MIYDKYKYDNDMIYDKYDMIYDKYGIQVLGSWLHVKSETREQN